MYDDGSSACTIPSEDLDSDCQLIAASAPPQMVRIAESAAGSDAGAKKGPAPAASSSGVGVRIPASFSSPPVLNTSASVPRRDSMPLALQQQDLIRAEIRAYAEAQAAAEIKRAEIQSAAEAKAAAEAKPWLLLKRRLLLAQKPLPKRMLPNLGLVDVVVKQMMDRPESSPDFLYEFVRKQHSFMEMTETRFIFFFQKLLRGIEGSCC
jgi:hypothetical protein